MNTTKLPEGYREILRVDFGNDHQKRNFADIVATVIFVVMVLSELLYFSFLSIFPAVLLDPQLSLTIIGKILVLVLICPVFTILELLIPAALMKLFSGGKLRAKFTNGKFYITCDAFFDKNSYIALKLSGVFILGAALLLLSLLLPFSSFWMIYVYWALYIGFSFKTIYSVWQCRRLPKDSLLINKGLVSIGYAKQKRTAYAVLFSCLLLLVFIGVWHINGELGAGIVVDGFNLNGVGFIF